MRRFIKAYKRTVFISAFFLIFCFQLFSQHSGFSFQTGHLSRVTTSAFSPDGNLLVTGDSNGIIILWDVESGIQVEKFTLHDAPITNLYFTNNGQFIVSCDNGDNCFCRNLKTGELIDYLISEDIFHTELSFSPDSLFFAVYSPDSVIKIIETAENNCIYSFKTSSVRSNSVDFDSAGMFVYITSTDKADEEYKTVQEQTDNSESTFIIYDLINRKEVSCRTGNLIVNCIYENNELYSLQSDGQFLHLLICDFNDSLEYDIFFDFEDITAISFSEDKQRLALSSSVSGTFVIDLQTKDVCQQFYNRIYESNKLWFSPSGKYLAINHPPVALSRDNESFITDIFHFREKNRGASVSLINLERFSIDYKTETFDTPVDTVVFTNDESEILIQTTDEQISNYSIFDTLPTILKPDESYCSDFNHTLFTGCTDFEEALSWQNYDSCRCQICRLSASGKYVAVYGEQNYDIDFFEPVYDKGQAPEVMLFEMKTGYKRHFISEFDSQVTNIQFSPEEKYLLTNYSNGSDVIYDTRSEKHIIKFDSTITNIAFFKNERQIICTKNQTDVIIRKIRSELLQPLTFVGHYFKLLCGKINYAFNGMRALWNNEFTADDRNIVFSSPNPLVCTELNHPEKYLYCCDDSSNINLIYIPNRHISWKIKAGISLKSQHFINQGNYLMLVYPDSAEIRNCLTGRKIYSITGVDFTQPYTVSPNGKLMVLYSKSLFYFYALASGKHIATMFLSSENKFAATTPDGYFMVSENGEDLIQPVDSVISREFYKPGTIQQRIYEYIK